MRLKLFIALAGLLMATGCQSTGPQPKSTQTTSNPVEGKSYPSILIRENLEGHFPRFNGTLSPLRANVIVRQMSFPTSDFQVIHSYKKTGYGAINSLNSYEGVIQSKISGNNLNLNITAKHLILDGTVERPDLTHKLFLDDRGIPTNLQKIGRDFDRYRWELISLTPVNLYRGYEMLPLPELGFEQEGQYGLPVEDDDLDEIYGAYQLQGVTMIHGRPSLVFDFKQNSTEGYRIIDAATGALIKAHTAQKTTKVHSIHRFELDTSHWGPAILPADHEI